MLFKQEPRVSFVVALTLQVFLDIEEESVCFLFHWSLSSGKHQLSSFGDFFVTCSQESCHLMLNQ